MLYKFGTVTEIEKIKNHLSEEIYQSALKVVTMLDDTYGAWRDIDENDGGFCLVTTTVQDVDFINKAYIKTDSGRHEYAKVINTQSGVDCVEALFLTTNEFGITVYFLNYGITPRVILDELEGR